MKISTDLIGWQQKEAGTFWIPLWFGKLPGNAEIFDIISHEEKRPSMMVGSFMWGFFIQLFAFNCQISWESLVRWWCSGRVIVLGTLFNRLWDSNPVINEQRFQKNPMWEFNMMGVSKEYEILWNLHWYYMITTSWSILLKLGTLIKYSYREFMKHWNKDYKTTGIL